jgi:hypothetical protein
MTKLCIILLVRKLCYFILKKEIPFLGYYKVTKGEFSVPIIIVKYTQFCM